MRTCLRWGFAILAAAALLVGTSEAKTFRWASQGDILTFDPDSQNESFNNLFNMHVYDSLVMYDKTFQVVPQLAVKWSNPEPTRWRFELRPNVKFHEGQPLTADDVVFSIKRAQAPTSLMKAYGAGIADVKKVNDLTVDIITTGPAPVLLRQLTDIRIMNKKWCEEHKVEQPQNYVAMRTGPVRSYSSRAKRT